MLRTLFRLDEISDVFSALFIFDLSFSELRFLSGLKRFRVHKLPVGGFRGKVGNPTIMFLQTFGQIGGISCIKPV